MEWGWGLSSGEAEEALDVVEEGLEALAEGPLLLPQRLRRRREQGREGGLQSSSLTRLRLPTHQLPDEGLPRGLARGASEVRRGGEREMGLETGWMQMRT